mmetsp:Transcript_42551/g.83654  ORF Transcript_42551/g.83654 Transcript_42551/m.83654 type:complete len:131 (+) Transcript_42551:100-492(+)
MCYHCLEKIFLKTADALLKEVASPEASEELQSEWGGFVYALHSSAKWSNYSYSNGEGKANPLTFSYAIVAEQMKKDFYDTSNVTTPQQMLAFFKQTLKRMSTVSNHNPYGKAVIGVERMPAVLEKLALKI